MKSFLTAFSIVLATAQAHAFLDGLLPNSRICRDTFVSMMNESTAGSELNFEKQFVGTNKKTGKACVMNIQYAENNQRRGSIYVEVPNSLYFPFNHYVMTSDEACGGDQTKVSGRYSFRTPTGWHNRYTTKLSLEKMGNGTLEVRYAEEGSDTLTCVGAVK